MGVGIIIPPFQDRCEAPPTETLDLAPVEVAVLAEGLENGLQCLGENLLPKGRPWPSDVRLVRDSWVPPRPWHAWCFDLPAEK